jgi:fermentation-respiration switch protein FrsA (DUF1100 family)
MPRSVRFPSGGESCRADLYLPSDRGPGGGWPVVVMAHGIGAERSFGLAPFAQRFADRGMASLVFDYRHFGESTGEPRNLVSPAGQVADYLAAMESVRGDPRLDEARIGLWGTSFSGGHVLKVASGRPSGLRAVVSQIPFVSGLSSTLAYPLRYHVPAVLSGVADGLGSLIGRPPLTVQVARKGGRFALLASPDSWDGYISLVPKPEGWSGRVPARVFLEILRYHPGRVAHRIEVPTLFLAATQDAICPIGAIRRVARRVPGGEIQEFPVGHFEPYHGEWFERFVGAATDFFERQLRD